MPQKIILILRPESGFDIPYSDGYQLYSSLLGIMQEADETAASHTHDSPISSISLGPLEGKFLHSHRSKHKVVDPNERYNLNIGITDPKEVEIFRSIIQPLVLREKPPPGERRFAGGGGFQLHCQLPGYCEVSGRGQKSIS